MIYVTSDLHGYPLEDFKKLLSKAGFSDNDFCFVLGDVIDRGQDGIKTLQWLMLQPNFELILGNHEYMLLNCRFLFEEITENSLDMLTEKQLKLLSDWLVNGANPTLEALKRIGQDAAKDIVEYLEEAPLFETVSVGNKEFLLTHSGIENFDEKKSPDQYSQNELLWARPQLEDEYYSDITTVFGHTPTLLYGREYRGKAIFTDTWINIDTGSAAGLSPMLLRLDDMREFYAD